ncbi:bursicon-like [Planococcus citri]|uniref:bursicon-like n=1 Tax=Planococcus citri TaxID=170843 RepID=UPI0031F83B15
MFYHRLHDSVQIFVLLFVSVSLTVNCEYTNTDGLSSSDDCRLIKVERIIRSPGCNAERSISFACKGKCSSYLKVSGSKFWEMERSCMCCQESGVGEGSVRLLCPKAKKGEKKSITINTKEPLECMCRPCTSIEESSVIPQEMLGYLNEPPISGHFVESEYS